LERNDVKVSNGGPRNSSASTLNRLLFDAAAKYRKPNALQVKRNGAYEPISHDTLLERIRHAALGLESLGVKPHDHVAILSENCPEWAISDFACLMLGVTNVPVYPNLPPDQVCYILRDSEAVAIFVSDAEQAAKVASIRGKCASLTHVITFASERGTADMTLAALETAGTKADTADARAGFERRALAVEPDDVATIIYTSGTTGEPKGVMLTHDNIYSNVMAGASAIPYAGEDVCLSFLPLSHTFERTAGHYTMLAMGTSIAYAESVDTVPQNLAEVRPTLVLSVPRLYEKMYARVLENATAGSAMKTRIFFWARGVAERWANEKLAGREPGGLLGVQYRLAQRLVFSKLKARTGGRLRYFVSGGAPLAPEINKFFYAAGLVILEGYGLTETSPVLAVNTPKDFRIGTVGKPIAGTEIAIADDGEILARGPQIMKGYFNKPEATADTIDRDGWFHTGDIGELRDGFLAITDRKKDIIVTAGGKNIAPQPIENLAKTSTFVSQAIMLGDKRKYPIMLVVPNWDSLEKWARSENISFATRGELMSLPPVQQKMEGEIETKLAGLARFEMPKKIGLIEHEFSVESGELTPTLKVKRRIVDQRYKEQIDALYAGADREGETAVESRHR
jgi:long-chain acyl-CoA synthetase